MYEVFPCSYTVKMNYDFQDSQLGVHRNILFRFSTFLKHCTENSMLLHANTKYSRYCFIRNKFYYRPPFSIIIIFLTFAS